MINDAFGTLSDALAMLQWTVGRADPRVSLPEPKIGVVSVCPPVIGLQRGSSLASMRRCGARGWRLGRAVGCVARSLPTRLLHTSSDASYTCDK